MQRKTILILCAVAGLFAAGCPKGGEHYDAGRKAEDLQDYDTALQYYQKALASDPHNADYRIKLNQIRFETGEFHVKKGQDLSRLHRPHERGRSSFHGSFRPFEYGFSTACPRRMTACTTTASSSCPMPGR